MHKKDILRNTEWVLVILVFLLGASIAFRSQTAIIRFYSTDDAYYYFQTARNAVSGNGLSFDGIARSNGYHPLWMLICLPVFTLSAVNVWLPLRVLAVIHAALHAAAGLFLFRSLQLHLSRALSLALMAFWLFSISIYTVAGMSGLESGVNAFCLILFFYAALRWEQGTPLLGKTKGLWLLGVLAVLTLMARLDNIFLLGLMGMWLVLKDRRLDRRLILLDIVLAAGTVMLTYFGRFRFSNSFYNMMPAIKLMTVLALTAQPGVLILLGASEMRWIQSRHFVWSLLRWGAGTLLASGLVAAVIYLRFPEGGYSRSAFAVQWLLFTGMALGYRVGLRWLNRKDRNQDTWRPLGGWQKDEWQDLFRRGTAFFVPMGLCLGAFLLFNKLYFGTMMPLSGKIKMWWGSLDTIYGIRAGNYLRFLGLHEGGPWGLFVDPLHDVAIAIDSVLGLTSNVIFYSFLLITVLFVGILFWKNPSFRKYMNVFAMFPLSVGVIIHASNYMMTGYVGFRDWYWLPQMFLMLVLAGLVLDSLLKRWYQKEWFQHLMIGASLLAVGVFMLHFMSWQYSSFPLTAEGTIVQLEDAQDLAAVTEPGSLIGMTGSGEMGYFIEERTIVNLDGLINGVEYYDHLRSFTIYEYLNDIGLDYVLGKEYVLYKSDPYKGSFDERLSEIVNIGDFVLYRYMRP